MRKFSVRCSRRTWKVRPAGAAFMLLAVGCAVLFPSFHSSAETVPTTMAEDQWIMSVYQKGKEAYDRGNYQAATGEWDKLGSVLDRYPAFKTVIDYLRGRAKTIASEDTEEVDRKLAERRRRIQQIFQKGKELYDKGEFEPATKEWQKLASYLPEDSPDRRVLADLKEYQEAAKLKPASKKKNEGVLSPEESAKIHDFLEKASADLKQKADQIKESVGNDTATDQNAVKDSFEKAKWLYFQGNTEDAVAELDKVSSLLPQDAAERRAIEKLMLSYRQSRDLQKEADEAAAKKETKYNAPEGFAEFVEQARGKFAAQVKESEVQRLASEKIVADRRSWAAEDVQKGKKLFEEGNTEAAIQLWEKTAASYENEQSLRDLIQGLKTEQENSVMAQQAAKTAESKKDAKLSASEEFPKLLQELLTRLQTQKESAQSRKTKAEREIVDRQAFVTGGFEKGRAYYEQGKFEEALAAWGPILTGLLEEPKLRAELERAEQAWKDLAFARKAAEDAEARKLLKLSAPLGLEKLLADQAQKLKEETEAANDRRRAAEKHFTDRQKMVTNTFDNGRAMFEEGKFQEAVKEWGAMMSELADAEKIKGQMQGIETAYQDSVAAQQAAKDAEAKKDEKLPPPAGFLALVNELQSRLKSQADASASRKLAADKAFSDKLAAVDEIFYKGKAFIEQAKLPEALEQWSEMLPYLQDEAKIRGYLDELAASHQESLKAKKAAEDAESIKDSRVSTPEELVKALGDISARTKVETQLAVERRQKADQLLEDRKTLVRNTYLKGKSFFDEDKLTEAVNEWSSILSNLEEASRLKPLIDQALEDTQELAAAQKAAADAEARKDSMLKTPDGLVELLSGANTRLKMQTADAEGQRKKSEAYLAERQLQVNETVAKGNELFEQGQWDQAKETWMSVLPSIADGQNFETTVAELEKVHLERQGVQKKLDEANAWKDVKFKTPSDISKELADAREKLLAQTHEAELAKQKAEQSLARRQAEIQAAFDKGKAFYWEGKIAEAIQEWTSITPHLEDSSIKTSIEGLTASYDSLLKFQQDAQNAEFRKDGKLKTPEELPKLLGDAKQIIQSQTQYAETQKKLADQTFVDRQSLINSTFQKGKMLYEQDRIPEALEEWATITPYLEKGSQLKAFIDNVARNYESSQIAKKVADEAEVKKNIRFRTPEDLTRLLDEASQKLNAQTEDSKMQKDLAEKTRADRQAFIEKNFQKGKRLYESGDVSGAVDAWTALIPYIEDDAKIRQLILKVEENRRMLQEASAQVPAASETQKRAEVPPDFARMLEDSNRTLEKKAGEKGRQKLEADVRQVIQEKKDRSRKTADKKTAAAPVVMDEIEQMMVEYKIATPNEIEKRHQDLKAAAVK